VPRRSSGGTTHLRDLDPASIVVAQELATAFVDVERCENLADVLQASLLALADVVAKA